MQKKNQKSLNENFLFQSLSEITFSDEDIENRYFEVLKAGKKVYQGGVMEITKQMLSDFADNFRKNVVGTQLALDINHDPEHKAYAWVDDVKVEGDSLYMKFKDFSEEGEKFIKQKAFKYFSVEFQTKFENIIDGAKRVFSNVLRGIALTNRPVDKAIQPTFLSEDSNLFLNELFMFKKFLAEMQKKAKLSKDDLAMVKTLFSDLPEEEKEEVKEEVKDLEAKVEAAPVEAPSDAEIEKKAEELAEKKYAKTLSELQADLDKERNFRRLSETTNEVAKISLFGESNQIAPASREAVVKFLMTLSEAQANEAINVLKNLKVVDFGEHGEEGSEEELVKDEETAAVEKHMSENPSKYSK